MTSRIFMFVGCALIFVLVGVKTFKCVNLLVSPASTVFDAQDLGYRVLLVEDACKGINQEKVEETIQIIKENNGLVINSKEVIQEPVLF